MIDALPVFWCYCILFLILGGALVCNAQMTRTPNHPTVRFGLSVDEFFGNLGDLLANPRLFRVLCGTGLFWFCAAVMKMNFQPWGLGFVHLAEGANLPTYINTRISLYVVWLTVGIVFGSFLAGRLHRVGDLRYSRLYGWGLATLIAVLGTAELVYQAGYARGETPIVFLLISIGVFAGCFLIPLNAALQSESEPARLGKTIAAQNFVDNMAMLLAGASVFVANRAMIKPSEIFLFLAALAALAVTALKIPKPKPQIQPGEVTPEI